MPELRALLIGVFLIVPETGFSSASEDGGDVAQSLRSPTRIHIRFCSFLVPGNRGHVKNGVKRAMRNSGFGCDDEEYGYRYPMSSMEYPFLFQMEVNVSPIRRIQVGAWGDLAPNGSDVTGRTCFMVDGQSEARYISEVVKRRRRGIVADFVLLESPGREPLEFAKVRLLAGGGIDWCEVNVSWPYVDSTVPMDSMTEWVAGWRGRLAVEIFPVRWVSLRFVAMKSFLPNVLIPARTLAEFCFVRFGTS